MKRFLISLFLGITLFSNFAFAQKSETPATGKTKLYSEMGFDEKLRFVSAKSDEMLALFGRTEGDQINAEGLRMIRTYLDSYIRRSSIAKEDSCAKFGRNDLISVLKRGNQNAAAINEEFSARNLPPQLGLYTAMIESEFCPCIQSPTGALGMFQLMTAVGSMYGLNTIKGATPEKPDERCEPKLAARASAKYYKSMIDTIFGRDAVGFPLAIGSYNRGEGSMKLHITDVSAITKAPRISFWVLIETREKLTEKFNNESNDEELSSTPKYLEQFEMENIRYVPKFFAAAIIGENPKTFGIDMLPLSQTK